MRSSRLPYPACSDVTKLATEGIAMRYVLARANREAACCNSGMRNPSSRHDGGTTKTVSWRRSRGQQGLGWRNLRIQLQDRAQGALIPAIAFRRRPWCMVKRDSASVCLRLQEAKGNRVHPRFQYSYPATTGPASNGTFALSIVVTFNRVSLGSTSSRQVAECGSRPAAIITASESTMRAISPS